MRDEGLWIDRAIRVIFIIAAIGAAIGAYVIYHFVAKFW